ncbi:hypothetical protein ACFVWR_18290, partial [Leifsonia sp. NPDC058292]|uniref:hypothetical protein n=1 Tax=Leifsonia sp. NPDC058292 TaxID=3346428 RepID=UPI0036DB93F7
MTTDDQPPVDDAPEPTREERIEALAATLCGIYHCGDTMDELEEEDPEQARTHRRAARRLLKWLEKAPEDELRDEWRRGYDRGKERQKQRTARDFERLEAEVAELRQDRDPEGLRSRIRDLEYVARGYSRIVTGGSDLRSDLADALKRLAEAQRELAELKGVQ